MSSTDQAVQLSPALAARRLSPTYNVPSLLGRGIVYLLLIVAAFISIFPFFWMIVSSTNTAADIIRGKATFGDALWTNIVDFFTPSGCAAHLLELGIPRHRRHGADARHLLARRLRLRDVQVAAFRERIFSVLLLMLSIPFAALMVPLFIMMANLKLINTYAAIILPDDRLDLHHLLFPPGDEGLPLRASRCRAH